MAGKRRSAKNLVSVPRVYIEQLVEKAPELRIKALIALLYLTERRIGELLRIRAGDFKTIEEDNTIRLTVKLEKKKSVEYSEAVIFVEDPLSKYIISYLKMQEKHASGRFERHFFGFKTPQRAWQIITGLDGNIWPHWFRHMRLSHLSEDLDPYELSEHAKISLETSQSYVHRSRSLQKARESDRRRIYGSAQAQVPNP